MTAVPRLAAGRVEQPASVADAAGLLASTSGSVLVRGAGSKQGWAGRVVDPDLVLDTAGLDRLLVHNPADMTAAVEAGMPLRRLQDVLAEHGQWLALDPPSRNAGATLGGLLATGESGPRRLRYGALRDLVIGVTLVLADGTVAHAGGHVIKNVAGYDLAKLVYGSQGSLAMIAEVVLRLHPLPETGATLLGAADVRQAVAAARELMASPVEPAAVDWLGSVADGPGRLAVCFEGTAAGVDAQLADAVPILATVGVQAERTDDLITVPGGIWADAAAARAAGDGGSVALVGTRPSDLGVLATTLASAADAAGAGAGLASHAALGLHTVRLDGPPETQAGCLEQVRRAVLELGGTLVLQDRPAEVDAALEQLGTDAIGPPPSAVALLRAVKRGLDPAGRLAPGRFGEWW